MGDSWVDEWLEGAYDDRTGLPDDDETLDDDEWLDADLTDGGSDE